MRAKFMFVSVVMTLDAFVGGYAVGFNSRHVLIVDPKLPPYVVKKEATESKKSKTPLPPPPASKIKPPVPGKDSKDAKSSTAKEKTGAATKEESAKPKATATTAHKVHHH